MRNERFKQIDALDCEIAKIREQFHNGHLSPFGNFIKAYRDSEIGVHAHFNVRELAGCGYCMTAYAVNAEDRSTEEHSRPLTFMGQNGISGKQQPMFVDDIQLMEDAERVILAKSVIRLQLLDQCLAPFDYAMYSSARFVLIVAGNGNDRKLAGSGGRIASLQDQLLDQVIEARSELVDDLSGANADHPKPTFFPVADIQSIAAKIPGGIILMRDDACFSLEGIDERVEILDLLIGPLNFDPNTIEWMRHD